jgi:hypothetical protein
MIFHDMVEQLKMFTIANNIFLGKLSVGSQCLRSLQAMINQNRSSFKAKESLNEELPSRFLFALDPHYQIWLKQFRIATTCRDVNNTIIGFYPLVSQLPSSLQLFLCKPPSNLINKNTGGNCNNRQERQQPKRGRKRKQMQKVRGKANEA